MKIIHRNYQNALAWFVPRSIFIPYWITWIFLSPIGLLKKLIGKKTRQDAGPKLCIESGTKGWELIEYKELYSSACEFLGSKNVNKLEISSKSSYYEQVKEAILKIKPTHFLYSPRTGSQNLGAGLYQSAKLALLFHWHGIIPIAALTDFSFRRWRAQCAMVTAKNGIVVTQMSPKKIHQIFPHNRLIGPSLMPFSIKTTETLNSLKNDMPNDTEMEAVFTGSLYEPRTSLLNEIADLLKNKGYGLTIKGHQLGKKRIDDAEYWQAILDAPIILTTADQMIQKGRDWNWMPHFLFRYTEVLLCESLLVAPNIPGVERFFTPGIHFVDFTSPEHAAEQIEFYLENRGALKKISKQGKIRAQHLISARTYWMTIDTALGKNSFF